MPAVDAVAALNRTGGKSSATPRHTRFQARTSNMFSPEKPAQQPKDRPASTPRSSGHLQRRKLLPVKPQAKRRNSFSISDDDAQEVSPPTNTKKKKAVLKGRQKSDKESPLKRHGYDLQVEDNPNVNLGDSPAKNTRSKNHNPLETLAKAHLPIPEIMAKEYKIETHRRDTSGPPTVKAAQPSPRKRKAIEEPEIDDQAEAEARSPKRTRHARSHEPNHETNKNDNEPSQIEESLHVEQNHDAQDKSKVPTKEVNKPSKKQRRPVRPAKAKETDVAWQIKRQKELEAQKLSFQEVAEAERKEFTTKQKIFAKYIESTINLYDYSDVWMNMGAAAYMIQARVPSKNPDSEQGKKAVTAIENLIKAYYDIREESTIPSSKQEKRIAEALVKLERTCKLLTPTDKRSENKSIVKDMFSYIIPKLVFLIKALIRGRHKRKFLHPETLDEFRRLLQVSLFVCGRALGWEPAPSTLQNGIRKWTRNDITANLKRLEKAFQLDMQRCEWLKEDRLKRQELSEHQKAAREARVQKLESMSATQRERFFKMVGMREVFDAKRAMVDEDVFDIDDIDDLTVPVGPGDTNIFRTSYGEDIARKSPQKSRQAREPTIDLPPLVPVDLNEEEKMALLNGLQRYTGPDRYKQILDDHELKHFLENRKAGDLVKTARSFSQMMASRLGIEAYRADKSLEWLRSADRDA